MNKDEQVSRNLELAGWFFEHLLEHPSQLESQPDSQYLILIPEDDEELADANLKTARALIHKCPHCGSPLKKKSEGKDPGDENAGGILLQSVCP